MQPTRLLRAAHYGEKPNITGFNIKKFVAAAGQPRYDPWEGREAWRYRGLNTRFNRFKRSVPGFGIATVAFAAYCTYEHFFLQDDHGHHDSGHAEEKHH
ncbi:hypothetical protein B0T26DRAFT_702892 [Lasiosphaeria miniovina]|uniref:NADH-ubiquinone oxidoreductase B12 subunit n=1 Tax=Lasiosphaeria miniovina TaxID=1954250 RepID=A0AA40E0H8_9PEZI|nr:uncharacterized protein B0T26DRAFT_702892 [Lasiosphaeria miniovina]KAK0722495.1 hypothetical protein B0T26DRAFT_702892 [Lasiosphaeria miniovina]